MDEQSLTDEAFAEHHVVQVLINEFKNINPQGESYIQKFTTLANTSRNISKKRRRRCFVKRRKRTWIGTD